MKVDIKPSSCLNDSQNSQAEKIERAQTRPGSRTTMPQCSSSAPKLGPCGAKISCQNDFLAHSTSSLLFNLLCSTDRNQSSHTERSSSDVFHTKLWEKVPGHPPAAHAPSHDDRPPHVGTWKHAAIKAASRLSGSTRTAVHIHHALNIRLDVVARTHRERSAAR